VRNGFGPFKSGSLTIASILVLVPDGRKVHDAGATRDGDRRSIAAEPAYDGSGRFLDRGIARTFAVEHGVARFARFAASLVALTTWAAEPSWRDRLVASQNLVRAGDYAAAEASLKKALTEERAAPADTRLALLNNELGVLYQLIGRFSEAESHFQKAIHHWEAVAGGSGAGLIRILNNLAALYQTRGQFGKAERVCRRAVGLQAQEPENGDLARLLVNRAAIELAQRKYSDAESDYRWAQVVWERVAGSEHVEVAVVLSNLALVYVRTGRTAEAISYTEHALAIWERSSEMKAGLGLLLANLGVLYSSTGRTAEAEQAFRRALGILDENPAVAHAAEWQVLVQYAALLRKLKRKGDAKLLEARAQMIRLKAAAKDPAQYTVDIGDLLGGKAP
jgi:tetratricopeptide (TPR) repeat protein